MIRAADMLAPQPDPVDSQESESVVDWFAVMWEGTSPLVTELLHRRRKQGRERYGTELLTHDGRDSVVDALQEAVDLLMYCVKGYIEEGGERRRSRVRAALALVEDLAAELERR